jgi:hypothetical protein
MSADAALAFAGVMLIDPGLICSVMVLPFQRVGDFAFVV